ncbi:unnamed protein product [Nezara viridula]|uniref:Uncharacterized protein n=1 Tax=Nezara viridula TaxID=85310 RepID=A0A9P0MQE0_NEZVI|nr:unnamed protein product [Nezara viridula]
MFLYRCPSRLGRTPDVEDFTVVLAIHCSSTSCCTPTPSSSIWAIWSPIEATTTAVGGPWVKPPLLRQFDSGRNSLRGESV